MTAPPPVFAANPHAQQFYQKVGFHNETRTAEFQHMSSRQPSLGGITISLEDAAGEVAQRLIHDLCAQLSERYGTAPSPFSPADTAAPRTVFLVARRGNEPVGCGALRRLDDGVAEIKRMYVAPSARRQGIARRILTELETHALAFGYRSVRLETGVLQQEAIALYEACGYHRIPLFGHYVGSPISVCYEKGLEDPMGGSPRTNE